MTIQRPLVALTIAAATLLFTAPARAQEAYHLHDFEKITLTDKFYSEGATFGDINGDGENDIVAGPFWYEGPSFQQRHAYYEPKPFPIRKYSDNFFAYTRDFNGDGHTDILIIGFPGKAARWYENPGPDNLDQHWPKHLALKGVDNESPTFTDLTGDGRPEIVCSQSGRFGYAAPDPDHPTRPWAFHPISEGGAGGRFTHGLGVGDINGDGRADLLENDGWWKQSASLEGDPVWEHHRAEFGKPSQMYAYDVDGDGDNDVITALNAHGYGLSWFEQFEKDGEIAFRPHRIMGNSPAASRYKVAFSQLHAVDLVDMDGDGLKDIVTGKRYWAHGGKDPGADQPAVLYWFRLTRDGGEVEFIPKQIDDSSGVGTQVVTGDVNGDGLPDVVAANKKGAFVFVHERKEVRREAWLEANGPPGPSPDEAAGLLPEEAAAAMSVPDGFRVDLVAGEPRVHQPVAFTIDARGRLWVAEAYTYPTRAPEGQGRDKIVIFDDKNNNGRFETRKTFIDGLNLVSGLAVGYGGVWVGAAPNLLFIPDRDHDDKPDSEPKVILNGWDYHDTHETLNSFTWGPDGWLYGNQGIFNHSNVGKPGTPTDQRIPLNAAVWRYHPVKEKFEVFARGTSNPWGIAFDARGQMFITACVIAHSWHAIQGGWYRRQSGDHRSPYIYDDIKTIADHLHYYNPESSHYRQMRRAHQQGDAQVRNATDRAGGGHAHAGAMIYRGDDWPEEYRGSLFVSNIHGNRFNRDSLVKTDDGSGFIATHNPDFMLANDRWFRGIDIQYGPTGAAYAIDWYDEQACHRRNPEIWDRTNGRIYRITYGEPEPKSVNLLEKSDAELVALLRHENAWYARTARRILGYRAAQGQLDDGVHDALRKMLAESTKVEGKLRALWALHVTGVLGEELAMKLLDSSHPYVRGWAIQLSMEDGDVSESMRAKLARMSREDPSPVVRLYLASALQRMAPERRWAVAEGLVSHSGDADDHNLPLMIWYGVEPLVARDPQRAMDLAKTSRIPQVRRFIIRRAASDVDNLGPVIALLGRADATAAREMILDEMVQAFKDRAELPMPEAWGEVYEKLMDSESQRVRGQARLLAVRFGDERVFPALRKTLADDQAGPKERRRALEVLLSGKDAETAPILHDLLGESALRGPAIRGLAAFDHPNTPEAILKHYGSFEPNQQQDAINTLTSRPSYALALLDGVEKGTVPREDLSAFTIRQMVGLNDERVEKRVNEVWGAIQKMSEGAEQRIAAYKKAFTPRKLAKANLSNGRAVFAKTCMTCHKLYGVGGEIGPELTGSNRQDIDYLLRNIVTPNAIVGRDYQLASVRMHGGRVVSGMIRSETEDALTVQTLNDRVVLARSKVKDTTVHPVSMMPPGQLAALSDQDARDLIAYLSGPTQVPLPGAEPQFSGGRVPGVIEGEAMKVANKTGGGTRTQGMGSFPADRWSNNKQLFWTGAKPGDKLTLELPVEKTGRYEIQAALTRARDYGVVRFSLDGKPLAGPMDLFIRPRDGQNYVTTTGVITLGTRRLEAGQHELTVEIVGAHPEAVKSHLFGLDFLKLTPAQ